jgi:hypothetical protein
MNDYTTDTPRASFAFAAVGLAALTLGAFVAAPAIFDSGFAPDPSLVATRAPIEVAITPARIEVVGTREPEDDPHARKTASLAAPEGGTVRGLGRPVAANVAWALPQSEPCKPQG